MGGVHGNECSVRVLDVMQLVGVELLDRRLFHCCPYDSGKNSGTTVLCLTLLNYCKENALVRIAE